MRKKSLYIIFNIINRINIMDGEMLGYYFILMIVIGTGCWVCPPILKFCHHACCEDSDEDEDEYDDEDIDTPLNSPASSSNSSDSSSSSSDGVYEMQLKPDYSSSEELEDRFVRVKINDQQEISSIENMIR